MRVTIINFVDNFMNLYLKRILAIVVGAAIALNLTACKENAPTYNANSVAENQAFAAQQANMANEAALKNAPLPKLSNPEIIQSTSAKSKS